MLFIDLTIRPKKGLPPADHLFVYENEEQYAWN